MIDRNDLRGSGEDQTDLPCPPWCEMELGHGWDDLPNDDGRRMRNHGRSLGEHVDMFMCEYEGVPLSGEPVGAYVSVDTDDRTAAELRALAAELLNAADDLDRVTGAGSDWTEDDL